MNKFTYEKELRKPTDLFLPDSMSMDHLSKVGFIVTGGNKIKSMRHMADISYEA